MMYVGRPISVVKPQSLRLHSDRISERCICHIGHLSDCRAVHLPCPYPYRRILRRYGEGCVRTGGKHSPVIVLPFAVMAILPFLPFGTALTGTIALKVTANRAVFGYVQGVGAAAVRNRMTIYRPLVNLITLIGFCGEGNLLVPPLTRVLTATDALSVPPAYWLYVTSYSPALNCAST